MYKIKLSPYTKIFYTEWLLEPDSFRYNVSYAQTLYGKLDEQRLKKALIRYVDGYLLLNSHIQEIDGEPYWVKNDSISELKYLDCPTSNSELLDYVTNDFDLYNGPLYRFKLVRIGDEIYKFIVVLHHIVMDGSSLDVGVFEAISGYYNDENYTIKYSIEDQIRLTTNLTDTLSAKLEQNKIEYEEFWQQQLFGVEKIDLNFLKLGKDCDKENTAEPYNPIEEIRFSYGNDELAKLNQIKLKYSVTTYIYGQCIFALLLHRYTGQEQFAISYPIAIKEGIDFIYGAQLNINLIPYKFNHSTTIIELLNQSKEFFRIIKQDDVKYSYYPITEFFNTLNAKINDHLLNISFIQAPFRDKPFEFDGIKRAEALSEFNVDSVPREMLLFEQEIKLRNDRLNYRVRYDKRNFDIGLVSDFVTNYKRLFFEVLEDLLVGNDSKKIASYNLLDSQQYNKIVYEFNQTDKDYPRDKTIHQLFEEQVLKTPNSIAVIDSLGSYTYLRVQEQVDRLAANLCMNTTNKTKNLVAILSEKGCQQVVSALAIMKSGNAYLPLSIDWPMERIKQVLKEGKVQTLLVSNEQHKQIIEADLELQIIIIESTGKNQAFLFSVTSFPSVGANDVAYVIFTSGSTGKPKGVAISHRSAINTICAINERFNVVERDRVLALSELSFDLSVYDMFGLLASGGTVVFPKQNKSKEPSHWLSLIKRHNITIWNTVPQLMQLFVDHINITNQSISSLRVVLMSGDWIPIDLPNQIKAHNSQTITMSLGGATEGSIWSIWYEVIKVNPAWASIPYGRAMPNQKMYVLDNNLQPLPIGVIGEICIGGDGVALGYWNDSQKTASSFIEHVTLGRIYKTGDLGKWSKNGYIEIQGRKDNQIKISGYRIELGEIENKLNLYPEIQHAAVIVKSFTDNDNKFNSDKYLVAYYVAGKKLNEAKLYNYLEEQLPEYMLPSILMHLNKLPLTINGKLDRASLPEPKFDSSDRYTAPNNEQEALICEAFARILGIKKISINDDFFKLGGNSLQAISLTSTLQINFDVKVADIFNFRTPLRLAEYIYFGKNILKQKLEMVKASYKNKQKKSLVDNQLQNKINHYLENIDNLQIDYSLQKPITNILLTGATGYLGCNILNQLLQRTNYKIFLLVRADSPKKAINRIDRKFRLYFDKTINDVYGSRVFVLNADIEKNDLGLSPQKYQTLVEGIDSVIHAAALVKHYGEYDKFYSANVKATINLLEFTKLTKSKDFHYISTYSVLNFGFIPNCDEYTYTEDDSPDNLQQWDNVYIQTKLQGERQTIKYRNYGVNSNIYRVGNLAFIAENYRLQENIEDNAFFNWIKCLFKMKCVAQDLNLVEVSPVDLTAQAIVKLFDKKQLENGIYHVFNPYLFNISDVFSDSRMSQVVSLTMEQFVDSIVSNLSNNVYHDLIVRFLLHQGWLDGRNIKNTTSIKVLQNRTKHILKYLGFEWPPITSAIFNKYLELLKLYGAHEMTKKAKIFEYLEKVSQNLPILFYWLDVKQRYLGINKHYIRVSGVTSYEKDFAGKTPYDIYPKEIADNIIQHHKKVVKTGETLSVEESIKDVTTGEVKYFSGTISPLYDDDGEMICTIGTAIDITAEKKETERLKKAKIFENLGKIAQLSPSPFYWLDLNQRYLGINKHCIKASGATSYEKDFTNKTPYDLYPKKIADNIVQHHKKVIQTGEILSAEESIKDITTGEVKYFNASISPLRDDDEKIIGTIGISIDITAAKKEAENLKKAKVFEHLEKIAQIIPAPFYWLDLNNVVLGGNENVLKASGALHYANFIGKTPYDLYPKEMADNIAQSNEEIIRTGKVISQEEPIEDITTGEVKYFNAIKAPIRDDDNKIIGTLGISIDITAEKETERLTLETEAQKAKIEEHEKLAKIAHQVSHDMRSSLISLETMVTTCADELPESIRVSIRDATIGIGDIAHNLLCQYSEADKEEYDKKEARQPVLLSLILLQSLTEKRFQYKSLPVKFAHDFGKNNNFVFIKTEPTAFKRMISNLINNAVDAFEEKPGEVDLKMVADNTQVKIIIQDNGKGIPKEVLDKIRNNTIVSSDKKGGHGLGLGQVRETLQRNGGEIAIESTVGKGTKITLTFQIVASPEWIADEICVRHGDMVVILDDDPSVHNTWEMRFKNYMDAVSLKHFTFGEEAISYLNAADKDKLILLTDFELLKQEVNGLQVIERTQVPRSILVTSHFNKQEVRDSINKLNIKILPKQLAPEVPIKVVGQFAASDANLKKVDVVIVEDSKMLADGLAKLLEINGKTVDVYYSGSKFLENFAQYPKNAKFCLDYSLGRITGLEIAKKLNEAGFNKIYLCTGWDRCVLEKEKIPDCVVMLTKGELGKITKALME